MKRVILGFLLLTFAALFSPLDTLAKLGVGVGTGKIVVDEDLKPGIIYNLPPVSVINTGDESSQYGIGVEYRENQPEDKPPREWFSFSPSEFDLEPGQSQTVEIKLNVPLKAIPGNYFAFLSAFPTKKAGGGETTIGIAAASKLYFTIAPANFIQGIYYRLLSIWKINHPYSTILLSIVLLVVFLIILRKFVKFEVSFKKPSGKKKEDDTTNE